MRHSRYRLAGLACLAAVSLAGCASRPASPAPAEPTITEPAAPAAHSAAASRHVPHGGNAAPSNTANPQLATGARAAEVRFYDLYSARQFAASWNLLTPVAKHAIPLATWVGVHNGCPLGSAGAVRSVRSVTVFGDAAIVTETIAGSRPRLDVTEDIFSYAGGAWLYSPGNPGIYHHGSVTADITAARAVGFCTTWKGF
jgi:hypothetical protein